MNILDQSEKLKFELKKSVLLIKYRDGVLGCGYFNVDTFNKTNEAAAIVTGVSNFEEMMEAKVVGVSKQAAQKGVMVGNSGKVALEKMAG